MHSHETSLAILLLLGAMHGLNPGMGWLFAVSLGLQEQKRGAVWRAFGPLALGHALAIAVAVVAATALGLVMPLGILRWVVAASLVGMGVLQLTRHWHPVRGGMRVDGKDLAIWSFLMATAHGAGLMALPFVLGAGDVASAHASHGTAAAGGGVAPDAPLLSASLAHVDSAALVGTAIHTAGYLVVAAIVAVIVYEKVGLRLLRHAWINLNLIWAAALILTGVLTPLF